MSLHHVILVGAGLFACAGSFATEADLATTTAETLETVRVTGNYDNGVGTSDAASQGSVTAKLIENRPVLRPGELLEFVPGVIVSQHSGDGKANQYYLRGFNLDHGTDFATFVDGMPINMRTHAHGQGYTDLNFVIPELVSRIDYKKGTYYADEGDFATAGAAHFGLIDRLDQGIASLTGGEHSYARGLVANSNAAVPDSCCTQSTRPTTTGRGPMPSIRGASAACCAIRKASRTTASRSPRWATRRDGAAPTRYPSAPSTTG